MYERELREMATSPVADAEYVGTNVIAAVRPADFPDCPIPPPPSYPPPLQKVIYEGNINDLKIRNYPLKKEEQTDSYPEKK